MKKNIVFVSLVMVGLGFLSSQALHAGNRNFSYCEEFKSDEISSSFSDFEESYGNGNKVVHIDSGFKSLATQEERNLYFKIRSGCREISNVRSDNGLYSISPITVEGQFLNVSQIKKVLYAIQNDNPELFWISNTFSYGYIGNKKSTIKLNSIFSGSERATFEQKLKNKISEIISKVPEGSSDYEKELFFHDYIIDHCNYKDIKGNNKIFTAYGCLIDGVAVCEGYSKAMQMLLCASGVECKTIVGARESEAHMWNLVKIGGNWYHLDVTWDDNGEWGKYNYFNVDDRTIKFDHVINEEPKNIEIWDRSKRYNFSLPVCNSSEYNFFERNSVKLSDMRTDNKIVDYIEKMAKAENKYLYFKITGNYKVQEAQNLLFSSRKIFSYLSKANYSLPSNKKINSRSVFYGVCRNQNVLIVKVSYL